MRIRAMIVASLLLVPACSSATDDRSAPTSTTPSSTSSTTASTTTTTTEPPSTTAEPPTGIRAADLCVGAVHGPGATIVDDRLSEISGIAFSRLDPDRLWAHNDSGDAARLYAIGPEGATTDVITVDTVALDWEDMAAVDGVLYVADIGDNLGIRPSVRIVAIDETTTVPTSYTIGYPSGRPDAEAVIVDPAGPVATIITKDLSGDRSRIYEARLDRTDGVIEATEVGTIAVDGFVTGADLSADGAVIAVRTTEAVWLFDRDGGQSVAAALTLTPCLAPSVPEVQGEAIALHVDGRGYTTVSEGLNPVRNEYRLPPGT